MLFNSWVFLVFFAVVYSLYLALHRRHRAQNSILLVASYIFYGYWDWRFLFLLSAITVFDFFIARTLHATSDERRRRLLLVTSVLANLTILGFFKYFNFFAGSFTAMLNAFGMKATGATLSIVLPVGISFYTFQEMSYVIDVYRRRLTPTRNIFDFALFVTFFPQLVAGPIERATNLLPQVMSPRKLSWSQIHAGLYLIAWGYFQKVVIADNVGPIADRIFNSYASQHGLNLLIGVLAFSVQIFCDFSGYTDIARGVAKLMGFDLMLNFRLPYFALSPSDFWSRWHVSLSTWLRDYLYIPLGGNRGAPWKTYRNLAITMLLGGLWHGAAWNFVLWGAFHGAILILYRLFDRNFNASNAWHERYALARVLPRMALMFTLTLVGWVLFRARSLDQIGHVFAHIGFALSPDSLGLAYQLAFFTLPLLAVQLMQYTTGDLLIFTKPAPVARVAFAGCIVAAILLFNPNASLEFIYFQF